MEEGKLQTFTKKLLCWTKLFSYREKYWNNYETLSPAPLTGLKQKREGIIDWQKTKILGPACPKNKEMGGGVYQMFWISTRWVKKKRESKERGNRVETLQPKGIIKKCWKTNFSDFSRPTSIFFSHRSGFVVLFVYSGLL